MVKPNYEDIFAIVLMWTAFLKYKGFSEDEVVQLIMKKQHEAGWCNCNDWANEKVCESTS